MHCWWVASFNALFSIWMILNAHGQDSNSKLICFNWMQCKSHVCMRRKSIKVTWANPPALILPISSMGRENHWVTSNPIQILLIKNVLICFPNKCNSSNCIPTHLRNGKESHFMSISKISAFYRLQFCNLQAKPFVVDFAIILEQ